MIDGCEDIDLLWFAMYKYLCTDEQLLEEKL